MARVTVTQDKEKEVPTEIIAASIQAISEGVRKMKAGRLNDKALVLLIQNASPACSGYPARKPSATEVRAVLEGIENLEATYLKKKLKQ
jgi:hypothetical protein